MSSKKQRNHYELKEMGNRKNAKIISIAWHHNVLTEMFTIAEKLAVLYKKVKFLTSPNPRHTSWCNLKSRGGFFLNVQFFRYWKNTKRYGYCMHTLI